MVKLILVPYPHKVRKKRDQSKSNGLMAAIIKYVNYEKIGFLYRVQKGLVVTKNKSSYKIRRRG